MSWIPIALVPVVPPPTPGSVVPGSRAWREDSLLDQLDRDRCLASNDRFSGDDRTGRGVVGEPALDTAKEAAATSQHGWYRRSRGAPTRVDVCSLHIHL